MTANSIKSSKAFSVFKDSAICLVVLTAATLAGYVFKAFQLADADIIMLYIIAVLVISIFTSKMYFCLISSLVGVVLFNCFFTYPEFSFSVHDAGYPVTFVTMFITAFIAGTLANKLKHNILIAEQNAREKEEAALLAQNEQLRANMLRSISHDLRTPLTSISGNASTLISGGDTLDESTRQQIYTDIYSESMWLIEMVENLLYATRIEDGRMQLNISVEILDDIVQEAVRHTKRTYPKRNIIVDMYDEIIPVMADANLIVQVIVNLMDNAVKYSDEDSDVTVSVRRENAYAVVISVSDHGTGISDEEKEKVYPMILYNEANLLYEMEIYREALELCNKGIDYCTRSNKYMVLPYLLLCKSGILKWMEQPEEAMDVQQCAEHLFQVFENHNAKPGEPILIAL